MNWNQAVGGGGAIDLVMHVRAVGFGQALEWLEGCSLGGHNTQSMTPYQPRVFQLPTQASHHAHEVHRYLVQERCLPESLLEPLVAARKLYADPRANAVFLLSGPGGITVGAELRGTLGVPWRAMAPGSRKDLGFFDLNTPSFKAIVLCESAIDALSCQALEPGYRCLSTSGARPDPAWLGPLVAQGHRIYCGFDADPTGDAMAERMSQIHPSIQRLRPAAKDWNDLLGRRT